MTPSIWQILIVVLAIFLLFGARRLPQMMSDLGEGIKNFKKGMKEEEPPAQSNAMKDEGDKNA